jgi:hypothetical protein
MLGVMRDPAADLKRRDAMAMAAAPYLHPKLTAVDAAGSRSNVDQEEMNGGHTPDSHRDHRFGSLRGRACPRREAMP